MQLCWGEECLASTTLPRTIAMVIFGKGVKVKKENMIIPSGPLLRRRKLILDLSFEITLRVMPGIQPSETSRHLEHPSKLRACPLGHDEGHLYFLVGCDQASFDKRICVESYPVAAGTGHVLA